MQKSKFENQNLKIPEEVIKIIRELNETGYEGHIVGGCVRDLLLGEEPGDWDVTTNAKPEEIQKIFPDCFYENQFGTVGVKTGSENPALAIVEVTTYRIESRYTDKRHPDEIKFAEKLEDDLGRRDFTINAMAIDKAGNIVDLFGGRDDLKNKLIKTVGDPGERFNEDALRMMRAIRLACRLGFEMEQGTLSAIGKNRGLLRFISAERIRDEFVKIINTPHAERGLELLKDSGLLELIIPELLEGVDVGQNKHHVFSVWEHNAKSLDYACRKNYPTEVRLAALFHDIGKPKTKKGEGPDSTFYNHEIVGARMTARIMDRLKFPKEQTEKIIKLVRWHFFYYNVGEVTESSVRRLVANIGKENVEDLIKVREADRIGSGVPKARPYKLRHLQFMIDKVARDPISPKMLKVNGDEIMKILGIEPGPKVGMIIGALMNEVLDDPSKNSRKYLEQRAKELAILPESELAELGKAGKQKILEGEEKEVEKIKKKHYVA